MKSEGCKRIGGSGCSGCYPNGEPKGPTFNIPEKAKKMLQDALQRYLNGKKKEKKNNE